MDGAFSIDTELLSSRIRFMNYYIIHLPLGISKEFVYSSTEALSEGLRVVVSFNRKLILGISGKSSPVQSGIRYLKVEEVLDTQSLFSSGQLALAEWISAYYHCSVGKILFAMLPSFLQPDVDSEVKLIPEQPLPAQFSELGSALSDGEYHRLSDLFKLRQIRSLYKQVEEAEAAGLIEVKRKLSHKDKPRTANYIRIIDPPDDPSKLPAKQLEAYVLIKSYERDIPMAELSDKITYSPLKSLAKKGIIEIYPRKLEIRDKLTDLRLPPKDITLSEEQQRAISEIGSKHGSFNVNLLFGITGSGKTEVYIEVIHRYLKEGKGVIFLIPEIALTPQMVERFYSAFGDILAIQHSQLTERDRLEQWKRIKNGDCRIVIGARSAVFAPLPELGLIIVDEEHEQSYKQDNVPRYHGRDVAVVRAKLEGAQVILGSATPALESWHNVDTGKYRMQILSQRPLHYELPEVKVINLCEEYDKELLSSTLLNAINERLEKRGQVILFQNRRGFSSFLQCQKCGELVSCPNCEISMYYHRDREEMHCHYCGHSVPSPRSCPKCGAYSFSYGSPGTQKVEQNLRIIFPDAKILRMDSDSAKVRDTYKLMYDRMKSREVDILLGTQMISKGLDFPGVTLVGIINADISLNVPDFRAAERTFQLITQVAGRSGRGDKHGEVIIQTHNPEHYAITHATNQDYPGFATEELEYRRRMHYPPFYRLARILYQSKELELMLKDMAALSAFVSHTLFGFADEDLIFLGPVPAPFSKMNNLHRFHLIIKAISAPVISSVLATLETRFKLSNGITQAVDVDPVSLM